MDRGLRSVLSSEVSVLLPISPVDKPITSPTFSTLPLMLICFNSSLDLPISSYIRCTAAGATLKSSRTCSGRRLFACATAAYMAAMAADSFLRCIFFPQYVCVWDKRVLPTGDSRTFARAGMRRTVAGKSNGFELLLKGGDFAF